MKNRSIRIPEDVLYALQLVAEQEDRSVSDCIRIAVRQYCDRMGVLNDYSTVRRAR